MVVFAPESDAIGTYHGPLDPVTGDIPSWVRNVAVSVPGTTTTMTSFSEEAARNLQSAAGFDTAVFQWAGGRFPLNIPEAMTWGYAETPAPLLRDFVAEIDKPYVSAAGMGRGVSGLSDFPNPGDAPHYSIMASCRPDA